jgi:hypothetical protein
MFEAFEARVPTRGSENGKRILCAEVSRKYNERMKPKLELIFNGRSKNRVFWWIRGGGGGRTRNTPRLLCAPWRRVALRCVAHFGAGTILRFLRSNNF